MSYWKNKKTEDIYRFLAYGIDSTNERDGLKIIIYCPDDNEHSIYVREEKEFFSKFELVEVCYGKESK